MTTILNDIRYGVRILSKSPGFTAVAILALAIGIGANTSIFSVVNSLLLSPFPVPNPERLMRVSEKHEQRGLGDVMVSGANFLEWAGEVSSFESASLISLRSFNLVHANEPTRVSAFMASSNIFKTFGIQPERGRPFLAAEDQPGKERVVVISHDLWQDRFAGASTIIGSAIQLDREPYTVIGVLPESVNIFAAEAKLWIPLPIEQVREKRAERRYTAITRLKEGVSQREAQGELDALSMYLAQQYPEANARWSLVVEPALQKVIRVLGQTFLVLHCAVALVLLISCANVASLLLARGTARLKELSVRAALGADRWRVVRQLLAESLLLGVCGGAAGLLLTYWGIKGIKAVLPPMLVTYLEQRGMDGNLLWFTLAVSLLASLIFGLWPALKTSKINLAETLKQNGRSLTATRHRHRFLNGLVVMEISLALTLLIAAGLLINSFGRLQQVDPGFNPKNLLTLETHLPMTGYEEVARKRDFYRAIESRVNSLPGVNAVAISHVLPVAGSHGIRFDIPARPTASNEPVFAQIRKVNHDYFNAMEIPLLRGRVFDRRLDGASTRTVLINDMMARRYWPEEDPIGQHILLPDANDGVFEIVGMVGNVYQLGLNRDPHPEIFVPFEQFPSDSLTLAIRAGEDRATVMPIIRQRIREVDPHVPVYNVRTMQEILHDSLALERISAVLLMVLAGLALPLSATGIFGIMAYTASHRTHEMGIRMAMGARGRDVCRMVLRDGMRLTAIGTVIGLAVSFLLTRGLTGMLHEISPSDPITYLCVSLALTTVALLACWLPALRASRISPMEALRYE